MPSKLARVLLVLGVIGIPNAWSEDFELDEPLYLEQRPLPKGEGAAMVEVRNVTRVNEVHEKYKVFGDGCVAAVLDTGINKQHVDFGNRIVAVRNFTSEYGGAADDVTDGHWHGTHVAGIIAANQDHVGVAPHAKLAVLKILDNRGRANVPALESALQWILDNRERFKFCVANLSIGDESSGVKPAPGSSARVASLVKSLREQRIAVVVSSGNAYGRFPKPGMSFPAVIPETISVGSTYDTNVGPRTYKGGIQARSTKADQITPYSQRLNGESGGAARTDLFAPGSRITATGVQDTRGEAVAEGTSQAAPVAAGVVVLAQSYWLSKAGELPTVDQIERWLQTGKVIADGDDEDDTVVHKKPPFDRYRRVDAYDVIKAAEAEFNSLQLQTTSSRAETKPP